MSDWLSAPVFGSRTRRFPTVVRPSAYGIIPDGRGRLALARTPFGDYLPGGGRNATEPPVAAVEREAREECGLAVRVGAWRRTAIEQVPSAAEASGFEKWSTFCDAAVLAMVGPGDEADHRLVWVEADEALRTLRPASHRWAVQEWLREQAPAH